MYIYIFIYHYLPIIIPYNTRRKHMNMYRQSPCFNFLSHLCFVGKPLITCWPWECSSPSIHPSIPIYLNEGRLHIYNYIYTYYMHIHIYLHVARCIHIGIHIYIYCDLPCYVHTLVYVYIYIYMYCSIWFSISLPASYFTIYTILHHYPLVLVRLMYIPLQLLVKSY